MALYRCNGGGKLKATEITDSQRYKFTCTEAGLYLFCHCRLSGSTSAKLVYTGTGTVLINYTYVSDTYSNLHAENMLLLVYCNVGDTVKTSDGNVYNAKAYKLT